ncbi:MAG: hypothetical protein Phog2KO_42480 [Phototrophicaceae bacterium]
MSVSSILIWMANSTVHNINLIAANGTDSLKSPIDSLHPDLDHLLLAINTEDNAVKVLMGSGLLTMHKMAGYIPAQDTRVLDKVLVPDSEHQQVAYSATVVQFLYQIYDSSYPYTYAEWLHWVALKNVPFPYEALPTMLQLATYMPITRALTKRVLGSRGRWLVEQNIYQDWAWAKDIKPARRPRLTKYEKYEARVTIMLQKVRYHRIPVVVSNELRNMKFPWSARFSKTIISTFSNMLERQDRIAVADLERLTHWIQRYLHHSEHQRLVKSIREYNKGQDFQDLADEIAQLLAFRARLAIVFESDSA